MMGLSGQLGSKLCQTHAGSCLVLTHEQGQNEPQHAPMKNGM
jgi:hypothetical protein